MVMNFFLNKNPSTSIFWGEVLGFYGWEPTKFYLEKNLFPVKGGVCIGDKRKGDCSCRIFNG